MKLLSVTPAPHIWAKDDTQSIMRDVLIALAPAFIASIVIFGINALLVTVVCVVAAVLSEFLFEKAVKRPVTITDLSAAVTGVLLSFCLPYDIPLWIAALGSVIAIVVVKQLFGGLGTNFLNPALAGRAFLMLSYPVPMTTWVLPGQENWVSIISAADAVTGSTPLSADFMKNGILPDASLADMFIGNVGGCVGEVSAIALLIGGIYLIARKVIRIRIPLAYILTVAVLTLIFSRAPEGVSSFTWMLYEIFGGGLFLGAFFMATDYVTSPNTPKGEVIFGIGAGLLVVFIRYFGGYPEGVCYSILIMNICVWLIDKATLPKRFGVTAEMRKAEKEQAKAAKKAAKEGAEA